MNKLPFKVPRSEHSHESALLPQHYADQFGWEEMTAMTAQAWSRIPAEERSDCGIFAQDYGQAGAIDFFGRRYGLPPALSGHQTYFLWGPATLFRQLPDSIGRQEGESGSIIRPC
jgi:hypothetical protein